MYIYVCIWAWARENKLQFNEQVMLLTRRKRKENKEVKIYVLKQQTAPTSEQHEILGYYIRPQTNL